MEYKMDEQILQSAINTYGSNAQHYMLLEETAELQKEICKFNRHTNYRVTDLISEIADVLIMIEQVIMIHGITNKEVQRLIDYKLLRLNKNIHNEIKKRHEAYCELERGYGCVFDE